MGGDENWHGLYVLGNNKTVWAYRDRLQNEKQGGFRFNSGDTVQLEYNKTDRVLSIRN